VNNLNFATVAIDAEDSPAASVTSRSTAAAGKSQGVLPGVVGVLSGLGFLGLRLLTLIGAMLVGLLASVAGLFLFAVHAVAKRAIGTLAAVTLGAALCAAPTRAHADEMAIDLVDKSNSVYTPKDSSGRQPSQSDTYAFSVSGPGELSVHLYDLQWPDSLKDLSCSILSPTNVLGYISTPGEFDVRVGQAGMFYAYVVGLAGGALNVGMYSLHIDFTPNATPVPLPDAIRMLLVGLGLMATVRLLGAPRLAPPGPPPGRYQGLVWNRVAAPTAGARNESVISPA
jgi:hypothetical protein